MILKADTFVHQGNYEEAEQMIKEVLEASKDEFEAWSILCDVYFEQSKWDKLLGASKNALELSHEKRSKESIILYQIKALIETGNLHSAEERLDSLEGVKRRLVIKRATELRDEIIDKRKQVSNI